MTQSKDSEPQSHRDIAEAVASAAVTLAGTRGWRALTMADIAAEADVSLADIARHYSCKPEILDGFERMIDRRMLSGVSAGASDDKPRDRLFEVIMARFDALLPFRDGVRRIARELPFDSASGLVLALAMPRMAGWMLSAAGIKAAGPFMPLRLASISGLYLSVFRVWLDDESEDLAKTMAMLDRRLGQASNFFGRDFDRASAPPSATEPLPNRTGNSNASAA
jgi:AcrR family transcriptional regulator